MNVSREGTAVMPMVYFIGTNRRSIVGGLEDFCDQDGWDVSMCVRSRGLVACIHNVVYSYGGLT